MERMKDERLFVGTSDRPHMGIVSAGRAPSGAILGRSFIPVAATIAIKWVAVALAEHRNAPAAPALFLLKRVSGFPQRCVDRRRRWSSTAGDR